MKRLITTLLCLATLFVPAFADRGQELMEKLDYQGALDYYVHTLDSLQQAGLGASVDYALAQLGRANALGALGRWQECKQATLITLQLVNDCAELPEDHKKAVVGMIQNMIDILEGKSGQGGAIVVETDDASLRSNIDQQNQMLRALQAMDTHDYATAIPLYMQKVEEDRGKGDMSAYAISLWYLVTAYINNRQPEKGLQAANEALRRLEECEDPRNVVGGMAHNLIGDVYMAVSDYEAAKAYYEMAKWYYEDGGLMAFAYGMTLQNLTKTYAALGDRVDAKLFAEETERLADQLMEGFKDKEQRERDEAVEHARLYAQMGYFDQAEQTLSRHQEAIDAQPYSRFDADRIRAGIAAYRQQWQQATQLLERHDRLVDGLNSAGQFDYYHLLLLAQNYIQSPKVATTLKNMNRACREDLFDKFGRFSTNDLNAYWQNTSQQLVTANYFTATLNPTADNVLAEVYDCALLTKNMLLRQGTLLRSIVEKHGSDEVKQMYRQMRALDEQAMRRDVSVDSLHALARQTNELERRIIMALPNFGKLLGESFERTADVRHALGKNDVAIEFIPTVKMTSDGLFSDIHFAALVMRHDYRAPRLVWGTERNV